MNRGLCIFYRLVLNFTVLNKLLPILNEPLHNNFVIFMFEILTNC